jgi:ornithine decarboxylase
MLHPHEQRQEQRQEQQEIECFDKDDIHLLDIVEFFLKNKHRESDMPFYVINLTKVVQQYRHWKKHLPRITPYYAIKCNPDPLILETLLNLGCCFDCASKNEISQVLELGASPDKIIFANPVKSATHIKYARSSAVDLMTFDDVNELYKIKLHHPSAKLLLRIKIDDSKSLCQFNSKFGAGTSASELIPIFNTAQACALNLVGVSFHVGSNCFGIDSYAHAIKSAAYVFQLAELHGFLFTVLDIGGGFPGIQTTTASIVTFEDISNTVNVAIDEHFHADKYPNLQIIAEPGRYMVASSHILVANVIGKKEAGSMFKYYINDGVYSSYNCIHYDHVLPKIHSLNALKTLKNKDTTNKDVVLFKSTVFGPTCDSMDTIDTNCMLPELKPGDWVYSEDMGAYTISAATTGFNGFLPAKKYYCTYPTCEC